MMMQTEQDVHRITPAEFAKVQQFLLSRTGIELKAGKEPLVMGRLERRLRHHGLTTFTDYMRLLEDHRGADEARVAIDLLTTNETYFFRESQHFDNMPQFLPPKEQLAGRPVRVWSAASSTGEEAYTIALTLADLLGEKQAWEVVGTDISSRVIEAARFGLYPLDEAAKIPVKLLRQYCLKGRDEYEGLFTVNSALRARVRFEYANLTEKLPPLGQFDIIFLRNVMIYFGAETKRALLARLIEHLRPGGYLLIGHAESINGLSTAVQQLAPAVYRKPELT